MIPSIYLNLEDDVSRIVARIKREKADKLVLVCPKRCFLFNDSINLRLLKKQADLLKKEVYILTMDERGQMYAKDAGFQLKFLPKTAGTSGFSDIKRSQAQAAGQKEEPEDNPITHTVKEVASFAKFWAKPEGAEQAAHKNTGRTIPRQPTRGTVETSAIAAKSVPPKISVTDNIFPREIEETHKLNKKRSSNQKVITGVVALSLVLVLAVVFVILPKAVVVVYPKSEPITRDLEISLSVNAQAPDPNRLILPASKVDQTLEVSDKFQTQGKREVGNKARGMVQIYNFTRAPLNLKAGTTVLAVGSKTYSLEADVSQLRPTAYKNAKTKEIDESTLSAPVEIVATQGGESSNLPAGTRLEITNQVFGSKPQFLYAKITTAVNGGISRYLSVVSDKDITASKSALENLLVKNVREGLNSNGLDLAEKAYTVNILEFSTDKPVGTESPTFQGTLRAKINGLAFNTADLEQLIIDRISQTLSDNKTLQAGEPPLDYKIQNPDFNNGLASLSVHFEGRAVYDADLNNMTPELVGKTQNQVNEILRSKAEIDRIDITLAPAWQKNFPWFASKIDLKTDIQDIPQE